MNFVKGLNLNTDVAEMVCFVGGGGKTTAIFRLARELKQLGKRVLVTTTTNMFLPADDEYDVLVLSALQNERVLGSCREGRIVYLGGGVIADTLKIKSVAPGFLDFLFHAEYFDTILVEADGAKRKPIKAPAEYEPVYPAATTLAIGCIGLDALGQPVEERFVHREHIFRQVTSSRPGDTIDAHTVSRLIESAEGLFKGAPEAARRHVLLNKADNEQHRLNAESVVQALKQSAVQRYAVSVASAAEGKVYGRYK